MEAVECLNQILLLTDIPLRERMGMVWALAEAYHTVNKLASSVAKRLQYQGNGPSYKIFYSVKILPHYVYHQGTLAQFRTMTAMLLSKLLDLSQHHAAQLLFQENIYCHI